MSAFLLDVLRDVFHSAADDYYNFKNTQLPRVVLSPPPPPNPVLFTVRSKRPWVDDVLPPATDDDDIIITVPLPNE